MRLRRSRDFRRVWDEGRSWAHPLFIVWAAPHERYEPRIGIIASRKVGKAVQRNRARRLLREAARLLYPQVAAGWDIVLVARAPIVRAKGEEVKSAMRSLFREAGLLRSTEVEERERS